MKVHEVHDLNSYTTDLSTYIMVYTFFVME